MKFIKLISLLILAIAIFAQQEDINIRSQPDNIVFINRLANNRISYQVDLTNKKQDVYLNPLVKDSNNVKVNTQSFQVNAICTDIQQDYFEYFLEFEDTYITDDDQYAEDQVIEGFHTIIDKQNTYFQQGGCPDCAPPTRPFVLTSDQSKQRSNSLPFVQFRTKKDGTPLSIRLPKEISDLHKSVAQSIIEQISPSVNRNLYSYSFNGQQFTRKPTDDYNYYGTFTPTRTAVIERQQTTLNYQYKQESTQILNQKTIYTQTSVLDNSGVLIKGQADSQFTINSNVSKDQISGYNVSDNGYEIVQTQLKQTLVVQAIGKQTREQGAELKLISSLISDVNDIPFLTWDQYKKSLFPSDDRVLLSDPNGVGSISEESFDQALKQANPVVNQAADIASSTVDTNLRADSASLSTAPVDAKLSTADAALSTDNSTLKPSVVASQLSKIPGPPIVLAVYPQPLLTTQQLVLFSKTLIGVGIQGTAEYECWQTSSTQAYCSVKFYFYLGSAKYFVYGTSTNLTINPSTGSFTSTSLPINYSIPKTFQKSYPTPVPFVSIDVYVNLNFNFHLNTFLTINFASPVPYGKVEFGVNIDSWCDVTASGALNLTLVKAGPQIVGKIYNVNLKIYVQTDTKLSKGKSSVHIELTYKIFNLTFQLWYQYKYCKLVKVSWWKWVLQWFWSNQIVFYSYSFGGINGFTQWVYNF